MLLALYERAVASVSAEVCMPTTYPAPLPGGTTLLIAVGKAAAAMAAVAVERSQTLLRGLVITRTGHGVAPDRLPPEISVIEAGHPVPDMQSQAAAERALTLAGGLGPRDQLLMLVSGGGSALMALPASGVSLPEKQAVTRALLSSGATIAEINCVRKHLSRIKGGRLAVAAAPARVTTLLISDVPGDDAACVASGPTIADHTTLADARAILERHRIATPASVTQALRDPTNETPSKDTPGLANGEVHIIGRARDALDAAADLARQHGHDVVDLGDRLEGEARELGAEHAALALQSAKDNQPRVILSGGETTVTVRNPDGRGGRNLEYLLGLAIALDGADGIWALACDTDGIDGTETHAGAIVTPDTLTRARQLGLDARAALESNEAHPFFAALGDLVITGPTRTNVNDFRAILITPR